MDVCLCWCANVWHFCAGRAFLAAERCCGVCDGGPRLDPDTPWAGEEVGPWRDLEDCGLGLHSGSAGTYGAHQSQVSMTAHVKCWLLHFLLSTCMLSVSAGFGVPLPWLESFPYLVSWVEFCSSGPKCVFSYFQTILWNKVKLPLSH